MSFTVVVTPFAKREASRIAMWWRTQRVEAAALFEEAFEQVLAALTENPERGFQLRHQRRALVLPGTGHLVVYRVRPRARRVEILSIRSPR
ncbi:MAG: type II toxin-antitoxin system RelE/ParE family toxin [Deltaproteobacteria bacterium]|nr:type II toxin-antitoxin system RelE/ParE family toxin [Deltaproteobacteria bacterium]